MKRLTIAMLAGAVLGLFCIVGISVRMGYSGNETFLLATYYNRLLMGFVAGVAGGLVVVKGKANAYVRGAIIGFVVSAMLLLATDLKDPIGFAAGIVYGIIIDVVATHFGK